MAACHTCGEECGTDGIVTECRNVDPVKLAANRAATGIKNICDLSLSRGRDVNLDDVREVVRQAIESATTPSPALALIAAEAHRALKCLQLELHPQVWMDAAPKIRAALPRPVDDGFSWPVVDLAQQQRVAAIKGASARAGNYPRGAEHGYAGENAKAWEAGWDYCNACLADPQFNGLLAKNMAPSYMHTATHLRAMAKGMPHGDSVAQCCHCSLVYAAEVLTNICAGWNNAKS